MKTPYAAFHLGFTVCQSTCEGVSGPQMVRRTKYNNTSSSTAIVRRFPCELNISVLQQQQNLGRRFGTSKIHFSPPPVAEAAVRSKMVILLLLICCLLLLPLWASVINLCIVVRYFLFILVLQSS